MGDRRIANRCQYFCRADYWYVRLRFCDWYGHRGLRTHGRNYVNCDRQIFSAGFSRQRHLHHAAIFGRTLRRPRAHHHGDLLVSPLHLCQSHLCVVFGFACHLPIFGNRHAVRHDFFGDVLHGLAAQIQRHTAVVARAETGADITHGAVLRRGRAFDHVVDQAARGAGAGLNAAGAFEQLDAFLVVHADHGFGRNRQAFAAVVVAVVQRVAAHAQDVPIGGRVVAVGHAGVQTQGVGHALGTDVLQGLPVDGDSAERGFGQRGITKAADLRRGRVGDGDFVLALRMGADQCQKRNGARDVAGTKCKTVR